MNRKRFWFSFSFLAAASLAGVMLPHVWQSRLKGCVLSYAAPAQSGASHMRTGLLDLGARFGKLLSPQTNTGALERARHEVEQLRELLILERSKTIEKERMIASLAAFERFAAEHYGEKLAVVPARVIGRDATGRPGVVVIDKGTAHGLRSGAGVVVGHSAAGVVSVARKKASLVNLLSSPACKVPAYILRTGESTMVSGNMGDTLLMHHVFREAVIPRDICATSGELGIFPRGIIIGEVTEARLLPGALFQKIVVRPRLNLSALQTVIVLVQEEKEF